MRVSRRKEKKSRWSEKNDVSAVGGSRADGAKTREAWTAKL